MKSASVHRKGEFSPEIVADAAAELRQAAGGASTLVFAFVTPGYLAHIEAFAEIVRVDGHVVDLIGATGLGLTRDGEEEESGSGFTLLAPGLPQGGFTLATLAQTQIEAATGPGFWRGRVATPDAPAWIVLANPFVFDAESWLAEWNAAFPGVPCLGGLASGTADGENVAIFHNDRVVDGMVVAVTGMRVVPVVSQGCRPIGEPLTVTKAENNVVYSLGTRPAYEALESAFEGLTDGEKATARGNLFAGLAGTEYVDDFKSGDFLIRNILGADPNSGAVVIGGFPRVGQTLQYQLRDKTSADADWRAALRRAAARFRRPPDASLLFACAGRGSSLFGSKSHDAGLLEEIVGTHASAGFFCNGEIGPLGIHNYIHSYTASCALFYSLNPGK
jgi:small ligand-binding sensory domain FIST